MRPDEWAQCHEIQAIKGQRRKSGGCAGKVNVSIWGDLESGGASRNPNREIGLRPQESAGDGGEAEDYARRKVPPSALGLEEGGA